MDKWNARDEEVEGWRVEDVVGEVERIVVK